MAEQIKKKIFDYTADQETKEELRGYIAMMRDEFARQREARRDPSDPWPHLNYTEDEDRRMEEIEHQFLRSAFKLRVGDIPGSIASKKKLNVLADRNVRMRILPRILDNPFGNTRRLDYGSVYGNDIADRFFGEGESRGIDAPFAFTVDAEIPNADAVEDGVAKKWVTLGTCAFRVVPGTKRGEDVVLVDQISGPERFLGISDSDKLAKTFTPGWGAALWAAARFARDLGVRRILIRKGEFNYWPQVREIPEQSPFGQILAQAKKVREAAGMTASVEDTDYPQYNQFLLQ